jgi:hypothetical protein
MRLLTLLPIQVFFSGLDYSSSSTGVPITDSNMMADLMKSNGFDGELGDFFPNNYSMKVRKAPCFVRSSSAKLCCTFIIHQSQPGVLLDSQQANWVYN